MSFSIARCPSGHTWSWDRCSLPQLMENRTGQWLGSSQCPNTPPSFYQNQYLIWNINTCCYLSRLQVSPNTGIIKQRNVPHQREEGPWIPYRNRWHHQHGVLSYVPQRLAELMNLAERACETSCRLHERRQVLSKLTKDLPKEKESHSRSAAFWVRVQEVSTAAGPLLGDNHLSYMASEHLGGQRVFIKQPNLHRRLVSQPRNCYAWREHCWALFEILSICEWPPVFWHGQLIPCRTDQSGETGATLLIRHVCIFTGTACTEKVISCFHRARETVLILSDPSQKKEKHSPNPGLYIAEIRKPHIQKTSFWCSSVNATA